MTDKKKHIYQVPEGYFENLQSRLCAIPQEREARVERPVFWNVLKPCVALAACFAVAVVAGNFILSSTASGSEDAMLQESDLLSANIPFTDPFMVFEQAEEEDAYSCDDLAEYIIESGMSVDQLAYLLK